MPRTSGGNSKKEAGQARKAEQKRQENVKVAAAQEADESAAWKIGAKSSAKADAAAAKADESARKRREKEELLAAEEAEIGAGGASKAAKKALQTASKKKKGKQNDFAMLEDALQTSADKAVKKKKAQELAKKKKQEEEERQQRAKQAEQPTIEDPLLANTAALLDGSAGGRALNRAQMEAAGTSGLDAALDSLQLKGSTPGKVKALYAEFEAKTLPIVKAENPGLRLSQYKERVFALWKKSPENPANLFPRA